MKLTQQVREDTFPFVAEVGTTQFLVTANFVRKSCLLFMTPYAVATAFTIQIKLSQVRFTDTLAKRLSNILHAIQASTRLARHSKYRRS
jgi:hypothetical protein